MADNKLEIKIVADGKQAVASLEKSARALDGLGQKADAVRIRIGDMAKAFALGQTAFQALSAALTATFVSLPKAAMDEVPVEFRLPRGRAHAALDC